MKFNEFKLTSTSMLVVATLILGCFAALGAGLTMDDPMLVYAIIYGSLFLAIAWKFPGLALAVTFASAPLQGDLTNGVGALRFSIAEINLSLCLLVFIFRRVTQQRGIKFGPYMLPVMLYLAICMASSLVDWHPETVMTAMLQMVLYFILATILFSNFAEKPAQLLWGFNFLVVVCVFLSLSGLLMNNFFIYGLHKNGVGSSLGFGVIVCIELWMAAEKGKTKIFLFLATIIITAGLIFTLSRGAWIGAIAGTVVVIALRRKFRFLLQVMIVLIPVIAIFWNLLPQEKQEYAVGFGRERDNIEARYQTIDYARQQFEKSPFYGVGIGLRKEVDATNIFWITLAETGVPGLVAFAGLQLVTLLMLYKCVKKLNRNDKLYPLVAAPAGLMVNKLVHGMVDHYYARGPLLMVWASVGMATMIYHILQDREAAQARQSALLAEASYRERVLETMKIRQASG
ncbi:MAG: O-antigen polymerase family protein [Chthonomonadaceae bacterium]|nr:O-antigen polymerase family protein [Chthonomonadaceae bacterium]